LGSGDEIGVFNSAGLCCGAVVWNEENTAITVWGDDVQTADSVDGFLENDTLRFRIWNSIEEKEYTASADFEDESDYVYHADGYGVLTKLVAQTSTEIDNTEASVLPEEFILRQNHPNPFNPETTIRFVVKEPCRVVLKVYNLRGQEIIDLVNAYYKPGAYDVKFNAVGFSSGVYLYRIQMRNFNAVKKMVVLE